MATSLENNVNLLDIYLTDPNSENFFYFSSSASPNIVKTLLEKYGRFWISNDGSIIYRNHNGNDILVNNIDVGALGSRIIVRVNGIVIPTPALEQLKVLLRFCKKCNFNIHSELLNNINNQLTSIKLN